MTKLRFYIKNTKWGPVIEICFPCLSGGYHTASLKWRSTTVASIPEKDQFFSYENAKHEFDTHLQRTSNNGNTN